MSKTLPSATVPDVDRSDVFFERLCELCAGSVAGTVEPRSGAPFNAVFLACNRTAVIYESWSDTLGLPTGSVAVIGMDEIAAVRVSY